MPGPLEGIRVFDLTLLMVGPWSTQNLGALGADVIHVERAGIDEASLGGAVPPSINGMSVGYITWNMNKRELFLDLKSPDDLETAKRLIATCDVFVQNMRTGIVDRLGLSYEVLREINPRLIYVSGSGWGESGPMASRPATDNRVQAVSGFATNNGAPDGDPEVYRFYTQLDATSGNYLTQAVLLGLLARERTGLGQRIDMSMLECALAVQSGRLGEYLATGTQLPRMGSASPFVAPSEAFLCDDQLYLGIEARTEAQWHALCGALGLKRLLEDPRFADNALRLQNRADLSKALAALLLTKPARWWQLKLNRAGVPNGRYTRFEELVGQPQVIENGYIQQIETEAWGKVYVGGAPWAFSRTPATLTPTALVGEHTAEILDELDGSEHPAEANPYSSMTRDEPLDTRGPLAGLRVVELAQGTAGPYAASQLADAGAEVIKVEFGEGDIARYWGTQTSRGVSGTFAQLNRGKRSVRIDPSTSEGLRALKVLIAQSDVLVDDADFTREHDLLLDELKSGNPWLVHLRISGFGPEGPWSELPGCEIGAQLAAEVTSALGNFGQAPVRIGVDMASMYAAIYGVQGVLAALYRRGQDGEGQQVDVSLFGCLLAMRSTMWAALTNPDDWWGMHLDSFTKPPEHGFKTADGVVSFTIGRLPDENWEGLLSDIGFDLERDKESVDLLKTVGNPTTSRRGRQVRPIWEAALAKLKTEDFLSALDRYGADGYAINDFARVVSHPQVAHMGIIEEVNDGNGKTKFIRFPWRLQGTPATLRGGAPRLGEHTDEVLNLLLGISASAQGSN